MSQAKTVRIPNYWDPNYHHELRFWVSDRPVPQLLAPGDRVRNLECGCEMIVARIVGPITTVGMYNNYRRPACWQVLAYPHNLPDREVHYLYFGPLSVIDGRLVDCNLSENGKAREVLVITKKGKPKPKQLSMFGG